MKIGDVWLCRAGGNVRWNTLIVNVDETNYSCLKNPEVTDMIEINLGAGAWRLIEDVKWNLRLWATAECYLKLRA